MDKPIPSTRPRSLVATEDRTKPGSGRATGRVSKLQWLQEALKVLASNGVEAVRIADLARRLKISKSGFYWHFEDRDELLTEMKQYWVDEYSQQIILEVLEKEEALHERLLNVVQIIRIKKSGKYDLAFTSWAQSDPKVRELVDQVRDMRIAFIKRIFAENGCTGDELESRARLFVVYFSWSEVMFNETAGLLVGEPLDEIVRIIAGPTGSSRK